MTRLLDNQWQDMLSKSNSMFVIAEEEAYGSMSLDRFPFCLATNIKYCT